MSEIHTTIWGRELNLEGAESEVLDYIEKLEEAAAKPNVGVADLERTLWSDKNPLLETNARGTGSATPDTYDHPAWYAMLDILDRKRVETGSLDKEGATARYTMTVPVAAEELGIAESSVRRAVDSGRMHGIKRGGTYYLDPGAVASYKVSTRGQRAEMRIGAAAVDPGDDLGPALQYCQGTVGNYSLRIKAPSDGPESGYPVSGAIREGVIEQWHRVAVIRTKKKENDHRFFLLESRPDPGDGKDDALQFAEFYIRGHFKIVKRINNPKKALEEWKAFEPESKWGKP